MNETKQKKPKILAFNYFGGKYNFLEELYSYFPEHHHFIDLFCGSASVILNKEQSKLDTANDLDGNVINFFKVLREKPDEFYYSLYFTPVSRQEYKNCFPIDNSLNDVDRARRFFVRCRMSFQGSGMNEHTGFNSCVSASVSGMSQNVTKYLKSIEKLPAVIEKLKTIQFENLDYREIITKYDREDSFFYVDPPYELRQRNYKKFYAKEFTDKDHYELAENLNQIKGMAMVSGYNSKMYQEIFKNWNFIELKPRGHSCKNRKLQKECIWTNY